MDTSKHNMIFDPSKVTGNIMIAGVGSIGSALALQLAKLGLGDKLILIDDDRVENHNIANQVLYGIENIGMAKVMAADLALEALTGLGATEVIFGKLTSKQTVRHYNVKYLFMCVDSMDARATIFDNCVWMNPALAYFADGRMGARHAMCYGFNPCNVAKTKEYRKRWYPDEDVPDERVGGCSLTPSIGATAMVVACQMTWMFMNHINGGIAQDDSDVLVSPYEEIAFRADTLEVHTRGYL